VAFTVTPVDAIAVGIEALAGAGRRALPLLHDVQTPELVGVQLNEDTVGAHRMAQLAHELLPPLARRLGPAAYHDTRPPSVGHARSAPRSDQVDTRSRQLQAALAMWLAARLGSCKPPQQIPVNQCLAV
jgi:hypothetical protein